MKKTLVIITSIVSLLFHSCKKQDFTNSSTNANATLSTQKFFTPSTTLNQRNAGILKYLKNVNAKTEFVVETVGKIGYPRWDKIITITNKTHGEARGLKDDSTTTSIIPFVREQDTTVNACIVLKTTPIDTSYYYLCDWQYGYIGEDNSNSYDQEKFARFFMKLDKEVFNYKEFLITDSNLFSMYPQNAVRVKLNEPTTNLQEVCETTTIYYEDCDYPNSEECINGCDRCYLCMNNMQWETCYTVEEEGGGAPPSGPAGTGGGGTGNGNGTTPPNCPGGFVNNNCGPGWTPANPILTLMNSLNTLLDPNDEFSLDEPIDPNNALVFNSFSNFADFWNSNKNVEFNLNIPDVIISQIEKKLDFQVKLGLGARIDIGVDIRKNSQNKWDVIAVSSTDAGNTFGWSWEQFGNATVDTSVPNVIFVDITGYIRYHILIDGFGTLTKDRRKYRVGIDRNTGAKLSIIQLED